MDILNNGVASSVLGSTVVHVNAEKLRQPKTAWSCRVKGKVWVSDAGFIVENNSYESNGLPIRKFFGYKNQDDYDNGALSCEARNLGTAKLLIEDLFE